MATTMCPSPLKESNHLWLLAEASLALPSRLAPPPFMCPDSAETPTSGAAAGKVGACTLQDALWNDETVDGAPVDGVSAMARPRSASRADSSRSASPAIPGRNYVCRQCHREYASTDAVRKHCRQNHPEWLREQGQGCPTLYCQIVDQPQAAPADAIVSPAIAVATPPTLAMAPSTPSDDPRALLGAAESFVAFSKAAAASSSPSAAPAAVAALAAARASQQMGVATPSPVGGEAWQQLARAGNKRPRSVRCGKCDGCERDDCGTCKNCVDKPKFGGIGQRKQGCIMKHCKQPRLAH